jgi:hypothetical protein
MTIIQLPSGREVFDTGKVHIGLRAGERADSSRVFHFDRRADLGVYAEKVQAGLLHAASRARRKSIKPWHRRCVIPLDGSLLARIARVLQWLRLRGPRL